MGKELDIPWGSYHQCLMGHLIGGAPYDTPWTMEYPMMEYPGFPSDIPSMGSSDIYPKGYPM